MKSGTMLVLMILMDYDVLCKYLTIPELVDFLSDHYFSS